jgi:TM2 domain-containing membrane protein YozV
VMQIKDYALMQGMDQHQQMMFMSEVNNHRKSTAVATVLALFPGPWAVEFYLGNTQRGVAYLLIQMFLAMIAFLVLPIFAIIIWGIIAVAKAGGRVEEYNEQAARQAAVVVRWYATQAAEGK